MNNTLNNLEEWNYKMKLLADMEMKMLKTWTNLKKSKVLLIDEATANVDHKTDKMIQDVISDKFRDRTILTIAHRFNTIAHSDRILMLQQGKIAYFDKPDSIDLSQYDKQMATRF